MPYAYTSHLPHHAPTSASTPTHTHTLTHTEAQEAGDDHQTSTAILLSKLKELQKKIRDNRDQVRARGKYLQSQPLTAMDSEASYLSEVLLELRSLGADALRTDASSTELQVEELVSLAEDMLYSPRGELCRLDGIEPDWASLSSLHKTLAAQPVAARALRYIQLTEHSSPKLPLCQALYDFLCDPRQHANILCISGYEFAAGELASILSFLATDTTVAPASVAYEGRAPVVPTASLIYELLLESCKLTDQDIHQVATYLPDFLALHTLSLRGAYCIHTYSTHAHAHACV